MTTGADIRRRDRGTVLPLVLVFVLALGLVLAGTARYTATNLRYSVVVEERSDAAASAEAAARYAIQRVGANAVTTCDAGPVPIVPTFDPGVSTVLTDADSITITCSRLDSGQATLSDWAAVVTGYGVSGAELTIDDYAAGDRVSTGRIFLPSVRQSDLRINGGDVRFDGNLFYDGSGDGCATIDRFTGASPYDSNIDVENGSFVCWPQSWDDVVDEPPIATLPADLGSSPAWSMIGTCRVFEPGWYHGPTLDLLAGGHNYFRSGAYVFDDVLIDTSTASNTPDTVILGGYPHDSRFANRLVSSSPCDAAQAADGLDAGPHGVTWYFGGDTRLIIEQRTTMELLPMLLDDGTREHAVSVHVLGPSSVAPGDLPNGVQVIDDRDSSTYPYNDTLFQGQIWSPRSPVDLEDSLGDANGQITSGVVAAQLLVESTSGSTGSLGPDRTFADHELLLSATAIVDGVTVEARAVVEHRPSAPVGDRVAVRSLRIID